MSASKAKNRRAAVQRGDVLDWRGEERYARRTHCERTSVEQALGIPTRCR
jgi:hypothetical protein